jgi:tetratricopeptide (TPR) repeat protein
LILLHHDEYEAALVPAQEGAALVRQEPRTHWLPIGLLALSRVYCAMGEHAAATTAVDEGLELHRAQEDRWGVALGILCKADITYAQSDYAVARSQYAESLQELRVVVNGTWLVTRAALSLGKSLWHLAEPEAAAACWRESIAAGRAIGARKYVADSLLMLGLAAQQAGDAEQAATLCNESLGIYRQTQNDAGIAYALSGLAGVLAARSAGVAGEATGGHLATAASTLAAAARLLASRRMLQDDVERCHYEWIVESVRERLTTDEFVAACLEGETWAVEQCVAAVTAVRPS